MKKIAMSVAAATMLLGGLAGCGADNQATDMGANQYQTGTTAQDMRGGGATTGRHQGEGPLTDMMTRDNGRGTTGLGTGQGTTGLGTDRHTAHGTNRATGGQGTGQGAGVGTQARGGLFGGQGQAGQGGFLGGQGRTGQTGQGGFFNGGNAGRTEQGITGQGVTGRTTINGVGQNTGQGRAGGFFGLGQDNQNQGQTRTHLNNYNTRDNQGLFGTQGRGGTGMFGGQGTTGTERAGLTGGNRPGMVDEDGILRGRARGGAGALGTTPGHQRQGHGAMNLEGRDRGTANHGTGQRGTGLGTTGHGNRTGVQHDQGHTGAQGTVNYHKDYDGQTVQRMVDQIEEVDGVDEARVIIHDDDVVIGITADDDIDGVKRNVERSAKRLADGKNVRVVTDNDAVGRIRTMDNTLRTGTAFDEIGATFTDMLGDLGRAAQRPFERSR